MSSIQPSLPDAAPPVSPPLPAAQPSAASGPCRAPHESPPSASLDPEARSTRLPSPAALRRALPATAAVVERIRSRRAEISALLHGADDQRLLVVAGPCSIHDRDSALEYAHRLAAAAHWHRRELLVVMRTYVEKPRSGGGWKGFLNDPDLDGRCDAARGLPQSRQLLLDIGELGLACASELLDPLASQYLQDLLCWSAIGARTATSQPHRELASGIPLPVGVKNALDGDVGAAVQGALAARRPHTRLAVDDGGHVAAVRTAGNRDAHVVLRGGETGPNHAPVAIAQAASLAAPLGLVRPLLIDCSHGNSGRDARRQGEVCRSVLRQVAAGRREIAGLLLESHLQAGRQDWTPGQRPEPGRSITDACIGWEETADLLEEAAGVVRARLQ